MSLNSVLSNLEGCKNVSLTVAPQENGPQDPLDCVDVQKTAALQKTGVSPKRTS